MLLAVVVLILWRCEVTGAARILYWRGKKGWENFFSPSCNVHEGIDALMNALMLKTFVLMPF